MSEFVEEPITKKEYFLKQSLEYLDDLCTFAERGHSVSVVTISEIREFIARTEHELEIS